MHVLKLAAMYSVREFSAKLTTIVTKRAQIKQETM